MPSNNPEDCPTRLVIWLRGGQQMGSSGSNIGRLIQDARQAAPGALDRLLESYRNYLRLLARADEVVGFSLYPGGSSQEYHGFLVLRP
jgi:hypothetical protein